MLDLGLGVSRVFHRLRYLIAQQFAIAPTETVHGVFDGLFRQAECRADFGVASRPVLTGMHTLQLLIQRCPSACSVLLAQASNCFIHYRLGPPPIVDLISGQSIDGTETFSFFGLIGVDWNKRRATSTFLCVGPVTLVGKERLQKREQEGAEFESLVLKTT